MTSTDRTTAARPVTGPDLTRRGVLAAGGAVGALALSSGLPAVAAGTRRPVVGVLVSVVPGRAASVARAEKFVTGLRAGLGDRAAKVVVRQVPFGYAGVTAQATTLLQGGVDVLVACLGSTAAEPLADLCRAHRAALVVAGVGAQVVEARRRATAPVALHVTGQHWQAAFSSGQWAARHLGRTMHVVTAAPDAGYDSVFALQRGFSGAGGRVTGRSITHGDASLAGVVAEVRAGGAAVVAVQATGKRAAEVVRALRAGGVKARFLLDPTLVEGTTLASLGRAGVGAHLAGTRNDGLRRSDLPRALHDDPSAVHGHDTGLLVAAGVRRLGGRSWTKLAKVLVGSRVTGLRGVHKVDRRGAVTVPLEIRKVRSPKRTVRVATRPRIAADAPAMAVVSGRHASGYVNEYLTT